MVRIAGPLTEQQIRALGVDQVRAYVEELGLINDELLLDRRNYDDLSDLHTKATEWVHNEIEAISRAPALQLGSPTARTVAHLAIAVRDELLSVIRSSAHAMQADHKSLSRAHKDVLESARRSISSLGNTSTFDQLMAIYEELEEIDHSLLHYDASVGVSRGRSMAGLMSARMARRYGL